MPIGPIEYLITLQFDKLVNGCSQHVLPAAQRFLTTCDFRPRDVEIACNGQPRHDRFRNSVAYGRGNDHLKLDTLAINFGEFCFVGQRYSELFSHISLALMTVIA